MVGCLETEHLEDKYKRFYYVSSPEISINNKFSFILSFFFGFACLPASK